MRRLLTFSGCGYLVLAALHGTSPGSQAWIERAETEIGSARVLIGDVNGAQKGPVSMGIPDGQYLGRVVRSASMKGSRPQGRAVINNTSSR